MYLSFPPLLLNSDCGLLTSLLPVILYYNVTTALRLTGEVNLAALTATFTAIGNRHEALRTRFAAVEGEPVQVIAPSVDIPMNRLDWRQFTPGEREAEATRLAAVESEFPFNLATGPLLRVTLLQLEDAHSILLLNMHHIISDDWSMGVLVQELGTIYRALVENCPVLLPELPLQYADFSEWQREWFQGEVLEQQLGYWRQQLRGIVPLNLPGDYPKPGTPSYQGGSQVLELSQPLMAALKVFFRVHPMFGQSALIPPYKSRFFTFMVIRLTINFSDGPRTLPRSGDRS
ncbi:condensation domain-containing protein [Phormidium pseudopriestleyi]|uniref:condensation domain-containing protein n=1 Tax=Phormidium pseudopriestleyi TaxID=1759527 RepID=UPI001F5DE0B8|nr:condensation domain-containing protein [Phormidium pseudopriestleyi]